MSYLAELDYLSKVLAKLRLQTVRIPALSSPPSHLDLGLRKLLGLEADYARMFQAPANWAKSNTIYKMTDPFQCTYYLLLLPDRKESEAFLVGPFLTLEKTRAQLMEEAEQYGIPAHNLRQLESCYANIPVIRDESTLFSALSVLGESMWGKGSAFAIIDLNQDLSAPVSPSSRTANRDPEDIMLRMKDMEARYSYENQLMDTVAQGLSQRAERMINGLSNLTLEQRSTDQVRNIKNYCIVCNTLMRKAAERGGVHPLHLDETSSDFAMRVETLTSFSEGAALMREMVRTYCRLVRHHSVRPFSPLIQKTVAYIDSDLSGDLSLSTLASLQSVNASYLSTLFRRETGKTVTEYVTEMRMDAAAQLLRTTHLQIQTVSQHCGMSDVNYFSKVFKRHFGVTPKQFRDSNLPNFPGFIQ